MSWSAATACYVRLPPNLPNRDFFGLRWTLLPDLGRTKGTEPTEADELHGLPLRQWRNAADELHATTLELRPHDFTAQDCATVLATGVRAAETKTLPNAPKPMPLTPCTTQRRSPLDIKERFQALRRVNEAS